MIFKVVDASPLKKDMATVYWVNKQENTFEIYFDERDKQIIIDSKLEKLVYNIVDE
jgi:hypothetical protein